MATREWSCLFPEIEFQILDVATYEHLSLHLQLNKKIYMPRCKRFRFENVWLKEKDCISMVKDSWVSTRGKEILERINYCCLKLDEWSGGLSQEYKRQLTEYRSRKKQRARRDRSGIQLYNEARWQFLNLLERQETYWKQRSKQFWLQSGDQNTHLFHRHAFVRRKNNCIQRIKHENGVWRETTEEIQDVAINYFTQLYNSTGGEGRLTDREKLNQVTDEDNNYSQHLQMMR